MRKCITSCDPCGSRLSVSAVPRDLRHLHRPFHDLLSEAFAGSPGDDVFDISLIREEWMRSKVNEVYGSIKEVASLK